MPVQNHIELMNTKNISSIMELTTWLETLLHEPCSVWEDENGELILLQIRHLVARLNGLRIEIYPNEHPPPHFHVTSPNISASFTIDNCEKLDGKVSFGDIQKIRYWHKSARSLLIEHWNSSRPTNCVVGKFTEL